VLSRCVRTLSDGHDLVRHFVILSIFVLIWRRWRGWRGVGTWLFFLFTFDLISSQSCRGFRISLSLEGEQFEAGDLFLAARELRLHEVVEQESVDGGHLGDLRQELQVVGEHSGQSLEDLGLQAREILVRTKGRYGSSEIRQRTTSRIQWPHAYLSILDLLESSLSVIHWTLLLLSRVGLRTIYSISKASWWRLTFEDAGDGCWISAASSSQSLAPLRGLCYQRSDCYLGS